ncbi:two component sensor kinase [Ligilactobacillus equi DSM 15833 = JCM 10991]|nr:cell wall metabolism sensor histidine kinase WalK [Ligilactobacillus equi]KRL82296.1 two component sensor kinase [Ligilactobacillus equi DSM 15833 = JCM 10991]MCQ2556825.1 cell wall metabolism sensor histidine kinase WalK [Ligilactobacillus sp.]
MNKKKHRGFKFWQSIHFKFPLVFALLLLVTFQIVGAIFVQNLRTENIKSFKQRVELSTYVDNSLIASLQKTDTEAANKSIIRLLENVNNENITQIQVVDSKGTIRGDSNVNNRSLVGQKTTNGDVKQVIYKGRSLTKTTYNREGNRYYISITPLFSASGNTNTVIGAVYVRANMEPVYNSTNSVVLIFATASLIATGIGMALAVMIARAITTPIEEMRRQTQKVARGDYSGHVRVYSEDELGDFARNINDLAVRVEDSQETIDSERRRLNMVLTHMSDGVLGTDRRGNITLINEMAQEALNLSEEEALNKSILDILDIRKKTTIRDLIEDQSDMLLDFSTPEREQIWNASFSLIQKETGFIYGIVCVLHDVTEQQRIDRERREFVSNVSHELRTPLTSVRSYIEALSEGIDDAQTEAHFFNVAQKETDRMIRMINDLLNLSRMDSGRVKLNLELVNLNELFNYILNRFDMILDGNDEQKPQKNYTIKREFTAKDLWVELDTDRFIQVIDNIMNNAIKYSPDGGVITCRMLESNNQVILSISDQGLGIPRKDLNHVFDRFFRVDKARSRAQGGTGLGLAISKEVIEMHQGKIWADSIEGKGSTFYISLPYQDYSQGDEWDEF